MGQTKGPELVYLYKLGFRFGFSKKKLGFRFIWRVYLKATLAQQFIELRSVGPPHTPKPKPRKAQANYYESSPQKKKKKKKIVIYFLNEIYQFNGN